MLSELPAFAANALIGLIAVVLAMLFWRSTRGSRATDTAVMRIALVLLLAPFVAASIYSIWPWHQTPDGAKSEQLPHSTKTGIPPQVGGAPGAPARSPQAMPQQEAAIPPPPPRSAQPAPARSPEAGPPAAAPAPPPPPPAASPAPKADTVRSPTAEAWDVVPVYYGTDRAAETTGGRLTYSAERARRLEVGRALVTIPKIHEVPNVERPWVYRLPFTRIVLFQEQEDPARHFTLKEITALSREELAQIVRDRLGASSEFKDQALVFLHGFNNSFEAALFRTAQISYDLKFDGAPFLYSWPSKGQLGFQDYSYDRESNGQAEPYLRQFLEFVTRETGARSINIIAHSMGNQVLLNVLRDLKRSASADIRIGQIVLAAPDVDRDTFEFIAKEIAGIGAGITVLAASNDRALEASKRFWGGVPRAGDVPEGTPVVVAGIDTIDISALSTEVLSLNHNGYAQKHQLIEDIRILLKDGTRPPEKRMPTLLRIETEKGAFWRYAAGGGAPK